MTLPTAQRNQSLRRAALAVCTVLATAVAAIGVGTASAVAADTPGTYTNYRFPAGTGGLPDVTFRTTVTKDPGAMGNVFWSHQFGFTQGSGAYTGMQSNGGQQRTFLFSLWDATETRAGSEGSYCLDFGGEGVGKSCRMRHDWQEGHTYGFRVAHEGDRWFGVTVTDETGGGSFKLGSIRAGSDRLSPDGMVDWTEYFEWSNPKASCYDQPYSQARFGLPTSDGAAATAGISGTSSSAGCESMTRIDVQADHSVQSNGIGNSLRGPITGLAGKAVTTSGTTAVLSGTTEGAANQAWVLGEDGTVRGMANGNCLDVRGAGTAAGTPVDVFACHGGSNQQWRAVNGSLRNPASGRCLDVPGSATADGTQLKIWDCTGAANQAWKTPAVPAS